MFILKLLSKIYTAETSTWLRIKSTKMFEAADPWLLLRLRLVEEKCFTCNLVYTHIVFKMWLQSIP